jgi:hypothetical protein
MHGRTQREVGDVRRHLHVGRLRRHDGELSDGRVVHLYEIRDLVVIRMDIEQAK